MKEWNKPKITEIKIKKITLSGNDNSTENPSWHATKGPAASV